MRNSDDEKYADEYQSWYYQTPLYLFIGNDPVNVVDVLGMKGTPTVPGGPPVTPIRPPSATGPGGAIGYNIEAIMDGIAFGGQLGQAKALASLGAVLGAFDALCDLKYQYTAASNKQPAGCGCCVMAIWLAWQYDATKYSPPSGAIVGVRKAELVYVPKPCDEAPSGNILFGSQLWPGNNTTVQYKEKAK